MLNLDIYTSVGCAAHLLSKSEYHKQFDLVGYINSQIIPPIVQGQSRIYLSPKNEPTAFISWARLSEAVWADISESGRSLEWHEWHSGERLYFNDFIAPYRNTRMVFKDLVLNVFPNEKEALSLRRLEKGGIKKRNAWVRRDRQGMTRPESGT